MLNKEKYNLRQMDISTKTKDGKILFYELKIKGKTIHQQIYSCGVFACDAMAEMIGWLEEEYVSKILTEEESTYLSSVIHPFRNEVEYVQKIESDYDDTEYINMIMKRNDDYCALPVFERGTMYKGMTSNTDYTLEELGL